METCKCLTMTISECAAVMGISRGLAYLLARRDALPVKVIKCGRRMFVSRKAVEELLEGKNTSPEGS